MSKIKTADIAKEFVVMGPTQTATTALFTPTVYQQLDADYNQFKDHQLISAYTFSSDWPTWEIHPAGDEVVILMQGAVTFIVDIDGEHHSVYLDQPGTYVIVPRNTWHTAKIQVPTQMLFITPGEGTENKPI